MDIIKKMKAMKAPESSYLRFAFIAFAYAHRVSALAGSTESRK